MSNYFLKDFKAALRGCLERVLLGLWQVWSTKIMSVMIMLDRVYLLIVTLLNYFLVNHECLSETLISNIFLFNWNAMILI